MLTRIQSFLSDIRTIANAILGDLGTPDCTVDPRVTVDVLPDSGTRRVSMPCVGNLRSESDGRVTQHVRPDRVQDAIRVYRDAAKALEGAR
jgi:hypothetical protein